MNIMMEVSGQSMAASQAYNASSSMAFTSFSLMPMGYLIEIAILCIIAAMGITVAISESWRNRIKAFFGFIGNTFSYAILGFATCLVTGLFLLSIYWLFSSVGSSTINWNTIANMIFWLIVTTGAFAVIGYGTEKYILLPLHISEVLPVGVANKRGKKK